MNSTQAEDAITRLDLEELRPKCRISVYKSIENCRLFVGGIPVRKNKNEVWQELQRHGMKNILDIIMYRAYNNRDLNRGYVFVEFPTCQQAERVKNMYSNNLNLWGRPIIIDWSKPLTEIDDEKMNKVRQSCS